MDEVAQMNNQNLLTGHLDRVRGRAFTVHQENKVGVDSGTVNGVKFTVDEIPDQKVMNALDEVSRLFADRGTKPIGGHQLGEKLTAEQQYFTAVDSWKKILPEMPGDQFIEGRLTGLRQQVRDRAVVLNSDLLLKMAAEPSASPSVRYAVLQSMKAKLAPGEVTLAALIDEAVTKLMRQSGEQIAAAVRGFPFERQFAQTVDMWRGVLPEMPRDTLVRDTVEDLRRQSRGGTLTLDADGLLKRLSGLSVSARYAALQSMKARLAPDEAGLAALIDAAVGKLLAENGRQIATEINISSAVNRAATGVEELQELRDLYRAEIDGFKNPQECYKSLVDKRGAERLQESLDFLTESLGADLASEMPSRDPVMLGDILSQLKQASIVKTVHEDVGRLVTRMSNEFGERPAQDSERLTGAILQMVQSGAATKEVVSAFLDQMGVKGRLARLDGSREFQKIVRKMSSDVFMKESDRIGLVDASQDLMDDLIAEMEDAGDGDRA